MSSFTEDFNGTDSNQVGIQQTWNDTAGDFRNTTNKAHVFTDDTVNAARCETALSTADHEAELVIASMATAGASTNNQLGPAVRFAAAADTCYTARLVRTTTDDVYLFKRSAGSETTLAGPISVTTSLPDTLKLRVEAVGGNARLTTFFNGTQVDQTTDSSSPITGNVRTGITGYHNSGSGGSVDGDDFAAADFAGVTLTPGTLALTITTFAPTVTVGSGSASLTPGTLALTITTFAPTVTVGGAAQYTLTGPSAGPANAASTNFTVTPTSTYTGTFTPTAIAGVSYSPATLTWSGDASAKTFTVNKTAPGTISVSGSFSPALNAPASVSYTAKVTTTERYDVINGAVGVPTFYTIKNTDGTLFGNRTSIGVIEVGSGIYQVLAAVVPADYVGSIVWDQGGIDFAIDDLIPDQPSPAGQPPVFRTAAFGIHQAGAAASGIV